MPLPSRTRSTAPAVRSDRKPVAWGPWLLVLLATLVGAWLRLHGAGTWALWVDEAHTWRDATLPWNEFLQGADRWKYALPFLLLRGLLAVGWIGEDAASLRLPFVVVGIATVPLMAIAGRRLVGWWPAVFAAWLLALNPWHVFWSQSARGYALVVFAAVLAVERALAVADRGRVRDYAGFALALGVGGFSHPTAWFLVAAFLGFLVLQRMKAMPLGRVVGFAGAACGLALLLPELAPYLPFGGFAKSKGDASLLHYAQTTAFYFRPAALLAAAAGLALAVAPLGRMRTLLLASFCVLPFVALGVIGHKYVKVTARYAICALPAVTWAAAFACVQFAVATRRWTEVGWQRGLAAAVLPLLLVGEQVHFLSSYHGEQRGQRAAWDQAADFLHERAAGRPLRVVTTNKPTLLYYLRPGAYAKDVPAQFARNQVWPVTDWMFLQGIDEDRKPIHAPGADACLQWHRERAAADGALFAVALTLPELQEKDPAGHFRAALADHCELVLHLPCWVGPKDESVYVYVELKP